MEKWILPAGTILNGKYEIKSCLGEGGFGITYLAWDRNMETKIAIKEYFPANAVSRDTTEPGGNKIKKNVTMGSLNFDEGLKRYVKEASILAKFFDLPGIVSVKDFFYENDTAYFVMEYIEGMSLRDYLASKGGKIGYEEALALVQPVISSLHVIHQNNLLHRDISPDNIMLAKDGKIKLIDFGAARSMEQAADNGMTVMLKHGYAPIEQYSRNGAQGPYTDVYGVCAVLYRMITGEVPVDATDRASSDNAKGDLLVPIKKLVKKVPKHVADAIEKGLSILPESRQQNMQALYDDLYISRRGVVEKKVDSAYSMLVKALVAIAAILILVACLGVAYKINYDKFENVRNAFAVFTGKEIEADDVQYAAVKEKATTSEDEKDSSVEESTASESSQDADAESAIVQESAPTTDVGGTATDGDTAGSVYKYGQGTDAELDTAIEAVQKGILESGNKEVGTLLNDYSDYRGNWEAYRDDSGVVYVKYNGSKNAEDFSVIFEITSNRSSTNEIYISFRVAGALQNGQAVNDYNKFFKDIVESN